MANSNPSKNGFISAHRQNVTFFLLVISQPFRHISGLFGTNYQMSICEDGVNDPWKSI